MSDELPPQNANGIAGKPLYETADANGHVYESLQASNTTQKDLVPPPAQPKASVELHKEGVLPNLRTYQSDIADAVKDTSGSVVKVAVAQAQKRVVKRTYVDTKKSVYLLLVSILLILGSALAIAIFFIFKSRMVVTAPPKIVISQVIPTEASSDVLIAPGTSIGAAYKATRTNAKGAANSLVRLLFYQGTSTITNPPLDALTFSTLLSSTIPTSLARSFSPDFTTGLQIRDSGQFFVVYKTSSYEDAFAGMLKWEPTMAADLQDFLSINTSISSLGAFQDVIIKNKDVRELQDNAGTPILMYSFADQNTLVITTNENTLKEIFGRLTASQFVR